MSLNKSLNANETLDGFLISGQLDNNNAVGGQRLKSA